MTDNLNKMRRTDSECIALVKRWQKRVQREQSIKLSQNDAIKFALKQLLARKNG